VATAESIAKACSTGVTGRPELVDIDYGIWQFRSHQEVNAENSALFAKWFEIPHLVRFPGGESLQDVAARAADALRFLLV